MKHVKQVLMLVATAVAIGIGGAPRSASGQAPDMRPDTEACRDSVVTGMYRRCALMFEGNKVRRGSDGVVVAGQGLFGPPHLTRIVVGDSAMAYARLFERRSNQSMALLFLGGVVIGLSATQADCSGQYSGCAYDWGFGSPAFAMLLGGGILTGIGAHFQIRATRAGAKAVWWHNERFAR